MAHSSTCIGHKEREKRRNKISKLLLRPLEILDESSRVLIKKGPANVETSLKELEEDYESKTEWKLIKEGKILSIPVEELRMENLPKPDRSGQVVFKEKKRGQGRQINDYPVGKSIENLNESLRNKYEEEKKKAKAAGKSESEAEKIAFALAIKLPQFQAVKAWQDTNAEVKLKKALERMMASLKIPTVLIRSINLRQISALNDLGLKLPGDAEIDLVMVYSSGDFLHVNTFEVKRNDTFPWDTKSRLPNKQAVNKAENQLSKDLDILMALLAGTPPDKIVFHTLACYPDSSIAELKVIFCDNCVEQGVICQEILKDMSLLQKKTQVPDKPIQATTNGQQHLLRFTARCLSHQSLLHVGYRTIEDKEHLVTERHKYNIKTVDGKLKRNEYIVASTQQQKAIERFSASSSQRHLVLTGAAGTGKTVVALQVANNLVQELEADAESANGPVLVVTVEQLWLRTENTLLRYLDANTSSVSTKIFDTWEKIKEDHGVSESGKKVQLKDLSVALTQKYKGQPIIILMDEIILPQDMLNSLAEHSDSVLPANVTIIAVINPGHSNKLPNLSDSVLQINLTTPYRSTIAITSLARFLAKCYGQDVHEGEFGSDVEGKKPIAFDIGADEDKLKTALQRSQELLGNDATLLYDWFLLSSMKSICESHGKREGGPWDCCDAENFYGWEAERVVAVTCGGDHIIEQATRAKTQLILILVKLEDEAFNKWYPRLQENINAAAVKGLVDVEVIESKNQIERRNLQDRITQ